MKNGRYPKYWGNKKKEIVFGYLFKFRLECFI